MVEYTNQKIAENFEVQYGQDFSVSVESFYIWHPKPQKDEIFNFLM